MFYPEAIEGSLYYQITSAVPRVAEIIEEIKVMREHSLVSVQYPPETLHSIITNAVLHRYYALSDYVHLLIFYNRV